MKWLNPPFGNIAKWTSKCAEVTNPVNHILLLIPASVGSNYWADFVDGTAMVHFLRPRVQFAGADGPFPKDLALCGYGFGIAGYTCWKWK